MSGGKLSAGSVKRSTILGMVIIAVFGVLLLRVLYLQTANFEKYQKKVIEQLTTESKVAADRGKIYDRNGNVLATNVTTYRVFISPSSIQSAQDDLEEGDGKNYYRIVAEGLSQILGVSYETVYKQATEYTQYLDRTIQRKVDETTADAIATFINDQGLQNMVYLEAQSTRYYPYGSLASHVLGFTSSDGDGLYGIEYQYNEYLSGIDGYYIKARDSYGREMPLDYASYIEAIDGYNVESTIDATIQGFLEEQIALTVEEHAATNRACGIVMDVKTGAILAMATSSSFDLNDPWKLDTLSEEMLYGLGYSKNADEYADLQRNLLTSMWSNKAITESYIPGSTFKIITSSMGLEEGVVTPTHVCTCNGALDIGASKPVKCHKITGHGTLTFAQGLQQSCNVWFMTLGKRVGIENFQKHMKTFGYAEKTGIDLPGEGNSVLAEEGKMTNIDLQIFAFGQNFNVTPIQHISAISAVANGGKLMEPYVVQRITDNAGNTVYEHKTETKRQVISEDVCKTIATMLEEGVSGDGGAKNAYVAGYRVAAKTGTSEKKEKECPICGSTGVPLENKNQTAEPTENQVQMYVCSICNFKGEITDFPDSEKYVCSTVAYAPADDPQIAILILVDEPTQGNLYGSTVAAPYVGNALESILPYMGVQANYTQEELDNMAVRVSGYKGWSINTAKSYIKDAGLEVLVIGNGNYVTDQLPASGSYIEKNGGCIVLYAGKTPEENVTVPDLMGSTAALANSRLVNLGLNVKIEGTPHYLTGNEEIVVVEQSIPKGTKVAKGTVITLTFRYVGTDD